VRKNAVEDAAIDEDEAVTKLTTEVELRTDEDKAVVTKLTTEVELRTDEVPKLTAEVEFKMDVKLGLLRSEDNGVDTEVKTLNNCPDTISNQTRNKFKPWLRFWSVGGRGS